MANSIHSTRNRMRDVTSFTDFTYQIAARFLLLACVKAKSLVKSVQLAQMMSVLTKMSDQQLSQIGISRSDIPEYAERLMSEE